MKSSESLMLYNSWSWLSTQWHLESSWIRICGHICEAVFRLGYLRWENTLWMCAVLWHRLSSGLTNKRTGAEQLHPCLSASWQPCNMPVAMCSCHPHLPRWTVSPQTVSPNKPFFLPYLIFVRYLLSTMREITNISSLQARVLQPLLRLWSHRIL